MGYSGGDEEDVTRTEGVLLLAVPESALTPEHDVDLIARVRRLGIVSAGGVQLDGEGAVAEQLHKSLAFGAGKPRESFRDGEIMLRHMCSPESLPTHVVQDLA